MISSNKENYADKRQKQNSKKGSKKSKSASKEQADDIFPESNSAAKKGFSETVNSMVKCRFGAAARGNGLNRGRRLRRG